MKKTFRTFNDNDAQIQFDKHNHQSNDHVYILVISFILFCRRQYIFLIRQQLGDAVVVRVKRQQGDGNGDKDQRNAKETSLCLTHFKRFGFRHMIKKERNSH